MNELDTATDWEEDVDCCPSVPQCAESGGGGAAPVASVPGEAGAGGDPSSTSCPAPEPNDTAVELQPSEPLAGVDSPLPPSYFGLGLNFGLIVLITVGLIHVGQAIRKDRDD